ncbi:hypothetical protein E2C01_026444 [Portunus trituberculatus]|uniref:Uncharacterized protein n=1 Tax=Portunus trituberculatus TaxID=210409 RepID=A0A5B7EFY0_PORTR|nr:hypothetical protein [Portunus trituberculatus]
MSDWEGWLRYAREHTEADKAHLGTPVRTLIAAIKHRTLSEIRDPHLAVPCSRQGIPMAIVS